MNLKHDADGFLVGEPVDLNSAVSLLGSIRQDFRAIRQAFAMAKNRDSSPPPPAPVAMQTPPPGQVANAHPAVAEPAGRKTDAAGVARQVADMARKASSEALEPLPRRIVAAVQNVAGGAEEADPAVQAYKEVAEPLKRGWETIFGNREEKKKDGWFKRILGELRGFRSEQSAYDKAANKSLKALEEKQGAGGSDSDGGGIISMLLPWLARLASAIGPVIAGFAALVVGLIAIKKLTDLFTSTPEGDKKGVETIQENFVEPAKEVLKKAGIDKDAEIEARRQKNQREQNGADEYERMDRARAIVESQGIAKDSPEYQPRIDQAYKGLESQEAATKKGRLAKAWDSAKQYLLGASDKAGVDPGTVAKIAKFESGFNADAAPITKNGTRLSSAHGYGQFLDGTWTDMVNKYGAKYGVDGAGKLTKEQAAKYRNDKTVQAGMLAEFTRENIEKGRKFGGADDDTNVYAFHNLGDGDAKKLFSGMKSGLSVRDSLLQGATSDKARARVEQVIAGNKSLYGDGSISATEAYKRMGDKMRQGEAFAADARQSLQVAKASDPAAFAAPPKPAVVAAAAPPSAPTMPSPPPLAEAPAMPIPLASNGDGRGAVAATTPDAGWDLSNRRIAHIVTGGYSRL